MPNTLLTPDLIASAALANLYENTAMAQLVYRDYSREFVGAVGDTITVRKPTTFTAQEFNRTTGIVIQNASESGVPVTLNHFADVSFSYTTEDLTMNIEDFSEQFLNPAMEAISQKIDRDLLALRDDITQTVGAATDLTTFPADAPWNDPKVLIAAGAILDGKNVPATDRAAVLGAMGKASFLGTDLFLQAQQAGSTDALRNASIGARVLGFDVFNDGNIKIPTGTPATGDPTTEVGIAFHKTALALVTRQLALPKGAQNAAIQNYKGFGLRVVFDYDINKKQDVCSIDTLYGTKTMDADRAVLLQGALAA